MKAVCLLLPTLSAGDAVGHDVEGMYRVLRQRGVETHVLAEDFTSAGSIPIESLHQYTTYTKRPDVLHIYHHSIFWKDVALFLEARGPKVLRYHNVTPPGFFSPYSPPLAARTARGRQQTELLVRSNRVDLFLCNSHYTLRELEALGAGPASCRVQPPFHIIEELQTVPASVPLLERYSDGIHNVLFLGRVVANKGHRHLLGVIGSYRRLFSRPIRLFIVGDLDPRFQTYHEELHALAQGLRVTDQIIWTGKVTPADLKAYFLLAHAFLVMSEHEGFCVPLLEAMAYKIPIIGYAASAVSETVGEAGIMLRDLDYDLYAGALEIIFSRPELRTTLINRQQCRLRDHFSLPVLAKEFWTILSPLLE